MDAQKYNASIVITEEELRTSSMRIQKIGSRLKVVRKMIEFFFISPV